VYYAVAIALGLVALSAALSIRNIHNYWGSWEPLKRIIKPNPLRPTIYVRKHGTVVHRGRPIVVRWPDLNVILGARERVMLLGTHIGDLLVAEHIFQMS
jgi:hypothetical protein